MILFLRKIATGLIKLLYRVKIHNKENIPTDGALFVCNHLTMLDPIFILSGCSKDIYFLTKQEATKGLFGKMLVKAGAVPIDRANPSMESLIKCIKTLKEGHKLVLFPEGTRNKTGTTEIQPIKEGAAIFAVKAKSKIVPIIIASKPKMFRKTHVLIGEPFELSDYYGVKLTEEVTEKMNADVKESLLKLQATIPSVITKQKQIKG